MILAAATIPFIAMRQYSLHRACLPASPYATTGPRLIPLPLVNLAPCFRITNGARMEARGRSAASVGYWPHVLGSCGDQEWDSQGSCVSFGFLRDGTLLHSFLQTSSRNGHSTPPHVDAERPGRAHGRVI